MKNPIHHCGTMTVKFGKVRGKQRYKCKKCNVTFVEDAQPVGRPTIGDRPLTRAEIRKRHRDKLKSQK